MTILFLLLFLFLSSNIFSQDNSTTPNLVLFYNQSSFDSDTCCWRQLSADKKYLEAANLIVSYLDTNKPTNKHSLHWHTGQLYAMAQSDALAIKYFKKTYSIVYRWIGDTDAKTWYYYGRGTVAFMEKDKKRLEAIINTWRDKYPEDNNFNTLVRLCENWGKSYELALKD